jgi:hypothetical protein
MSGHVPNEEENEGSPQKAKKPSNSNESFFVTKEKVFGYATDIIRAIKDKMESLDDPSSSPLDFGIE